MLKPAFNIVPADTDGDYATEAALILEIGDKNFSYLVVNKSTQRLIALKDFVLDQQTSRSMTERIAEVIASDPLLSNEYRETVVIYSSAESNIIPSAWNNDEFDRAVTQLVYGNVQRGIIVREPIDRWDLVNVYRISREMQSFVEQSFAPTKVYHVYSLMLATSDREEGKAAISLRFYSDKFIALVTRNGELQLIQSFSYQAREDVSYQLLAICEQFDLDSGSVQLLVSGLIDKQSVLYSELEKYFLQINSDDRTGDINTLGAMTDLPAHYFSPLLSFASCA